MRQSGPGRHVGCVESASDGVEKILVGRQRARRRGTALERGGYKVARQNVEVGSVFAVAIAAKAMATPAVTKEKLLPGIRMPVPFADVGFLGRRREGRDQKNCRKECELIDFVCAHGHPPQ